MTRAAGNRFRLDGVWWRSTLRRPAVVAAITFVGAVTLFVLLFAWRGARTGDSFDFARWEVQSVANKWLWAFGSPFRDDPSHDEAIARYFATDDRANGGASDLENVVEAAIEGRIDAVVHSAGIDAPIPLPGPIAVFPPVDFELVSTPYVLVVSPRDEIRRLRDDVLRPDLSLDELLLLEAATEDADPSVSALFIRTGGIATYPAIVTNDRGYRGTVGTAAHEWAHHYLTFYPLGRSYFSSSDARALNETVADIVGDEIEDLVLERFGDPTAAQRAESQPRQRPTLDRNEVLRELRLEVDTLLAEGRVEDAERRMAEVRQELEDDGIFVRRINQAYFAWFGTYAARPDSVDPLGDQVREIRRTAGSLDRFLELIRDVNSRAEVEALLDRLRPADG